MSLQLFSQVNGDSDLIEAWLNYYTRLGVSGFHIILHGPPSDNERLLAIKDSYPITIEETYDGPFPAPIDPHFPTRTEKKKRLDALLARYTGQWVMLVDSDEFVEFPYPNIADTIRKLEFAGANVMAAPMLQRLTADGSLETPPRIDDPFQVFPLCSVDVYWRMGMKAEIFKFPLFYCATDTQLVEEGNHHPPLGREAVDVGIVGATHHFKFRRSVWGRLEKRVNSPHAWRRESVECRDYLNTHRGHLPLEGSFAYSREELFRRRLLRQLPAPRPEHFALNSEPKSECDHGALNAVAGERKSEARIEPMSLTPSASKCKKIMFILPAKEGIGGLERHLLELLQRLPNSIDPTLVICFSSDVISALLDKALQARVWVRSIDKPQSFWDWYRIFRKDSPDAVVFFYTFVAAFPWQAPIASWFARVRRRICIQYLVPPPLPSYVPGKSSRSLLRRRIGRQARRAAGVKWSARISHSAFGATICVCEAVREGLVKMYGFRADRTLKIFKGVPTCTFVPSPANKKVVREYLDLDPEDFLLVSATRLTEVKRFDTLIRAISRVVRQGISCRCLVVGDGPMRQELIRLVNSLGLSQHVYFLGFQQDVGPFLQAASAFILTSREEGLPMSVLEAMACGLPCIVTSVGGNEEAVKDCVNGFVVPPDSLEATADAILYLATHRDQCSVMGSKSREMALRDFDIKKTFQDFEAILLN